MLKTRDPSTAGRYVSQKLSKGEGASVMVPNGVVFFFTDARHFGGKGLFVSCTKGGTVVFPSPLHINRFACIRARMPGWAASFVEKSLLCALSSECVGSLPDLRPK